jgi:hypothetical protein
MNTIMITTSIAFILSIVVGRAVTTITRGQMVYSLDSLDASLTQASATNAPLTSLFVLLPVFQDFINYGQKLSRQEMICVKVWAAWAVFGILVRPSLLFPLL